MTPVNRRVFQELFLLLTALFAFSWAIIRACVQSITIDEADTYLMFASRSAGFIWYPSSNNHVLNSMLMWITTCLLGTSGITVRAPAILGTIVYICVCYFLCTFITAQFSLRLPLFICLTYNPFLFDFMVAGRGYSLALAFLLAAIAVPLWHREQEAPSLAKSCALASLLLGLSFSANFSFAFVDAAAFLAIAIWALRRGGVKILGACVLPGLLAALLICGYPVLHWHKRELWYGATSLGEMAQSIVQPSLFQLDPRFEKAGLYQVMSFLKPVILPLLGILCACQLLVTRVDGSWLRDARVRRLGRLGSVLAAIGAFAIFTHWMVFRLFGLLLPMGRTAIYLVPLCTLIAGIIAAVPAWSRAGVWLHRGLVAAFFTLACYFLLCLRLTYFEEWKWDAEVKDVYALLAKYNHLDGVTEVGCSWYYTSTLNFYRVASGRETIEEIRSGEEPVPEKPVYVLHSVFDRKFIDREGLAIVYRGALTDIVVAVRPEARLRPVTATPCLNAERLQAGDLNRGW
jgi:hypothetical protein